MDALEDRYGPTSLKDALMSGERQEIPAITATTVTQRVGTVRGAIAAILIAGLFSRRPISRRQVMTLGMSGE